MWSEMMGIWSALASSDNPHVDERASKGLSRSKEKCFEHRECRVVSLALMQSPPSAGSASKRSGR
ncbi:hypothetical protein F2Q69_00050202 [Brassica cretica]|uniref:Uncharacterized protein n=1 Tax=Brassica cretica TaxID=69181 RepID=A0A8S9PPP2_BRACR|nr:hypothetical protein F2Q69_00050202 [Brassica cretica]